MKPSGKTCLEASAPKLDGVEGGGSWARTARLAGGDGDGAVGERDEASGGDGDPTDRGGEVCEGRVAMGIGLRGDVPGDGPDLGVDVLQQSSVAHGFFAKSAGDGREGFHGDKKVGSGGSPGRAVLRQSTARDNGVDVGVVLELSAPGVQDTGATREVGADETLVCGEAFEGERRGVDHGMIREALM
jgi:hypothetical protein